MIAKRKHSKWYALFLLISIGAAAQTAAQMKSGQSAPMGWTLMWSDEFNGPEGSPVDSSKWVLETGGNGWGNQELEYYTTRPQNSFLHDGNLVIKVLEEKYTGSDGVSRNFTSARLKTQGKFSQAYGRFEARIKIPRGQGIWPAFWMLGNDIEKPGWPDCGEIDIMENIGKEPTLVHGTIHGPGYSGADGISSSFALPANERLRMTSMFCGRVGAAGHSLLCGRSSLCHPHSRRSAEGGEVGLRPSILFIAERCGGWRMAGKSGCYDCFSANYAGRLCARLQRVASEPKQP